MKVLLLSVCLAVLFVYSDAVVHNAACATDTECTDNNNVCDTTYIDTFGCTKGRCACATTFGLSGSACKPLTNVDDACDNTKACVTGSVCNSTSGVCECMANYFVLSGDKTKCSKKPLQGSCMADADCMYTNCTNSLCICGPDYTESSGSCVKKAFGAACSYDGQCETTASNCTTTCSCPVNQKRVTQDQYYKNGACLPNAATENIAANAVCANGAPHKVCIDGHGCVQCPEGSTYNCKKVIMPATTATPGNSGVRTEVTLVTLALTGLLAALL